MNLVDAAQPESFELKDCLNKAEVFLVSISNFSVPSLNKLKFMDLLYHAHCHCLLSV